MAARKPKERKTKAGRGALARVEPAAPQRLSEKEAREVSGLVGELNRRVRTLGLEHEKLGEYLLFELFGEDGEAALKPEAKLGARYLALKAHAGKSLKLSPTELYQHLAIGAITKVRPDDAMWTGLDWSEKRALLPLLALRDGRRTFNAGVRFAGRPNVGLERIIEWVQKETPRLPGSPGRPRGESFTLGKGGRFAEAGVQLGDPKQREVFADRLSKAPAAQRRDLVRDLRKTHENLGALLALLDHDDGDE
jgi:hypothetical protein